MAGGHGYGERRSQVRSVTRGRENRGGGGGPERERRSRGVEAVSVASRTGPGRREEAGGGQGEAGGGRGSVGARHASPLFVLLAEEEEDKGEEVGWAGQMELGQVSGASKWPR